MKSKTKYLMVGLLAMSMLNEGCKKKEAEANEEEVLTSLLVKLTPTNGGNAIQFFYEDADGPGGNAPIKQTIALAPNTTYNTELSVLNVTTNPTTNVTPEIVAEGQAHRFYFQQTVGSNITITNLNTDAGGISLGNTSRWQTITAGNGKLKITLRHYPNNPPNKAESDAVNSSKSATDMEVEFDTTVN